VFFFSKTKNNKSLWFIVLSCLLSLLILLASTLVSDREKHYFYSLFVLVEYLLFAFFLWNNLQNNKSKVILLFLSICFSVFIIISTISFKIRRLDSISIGIESIIILTFCIYLLFEMLNSVRDMFIYYDFRFWIIIGIVLYLAGSFFLYIFDETLSPNQRNHIWFLTWVFYIIKALFFSLSIIVSLKRSKGSSNQPKTIPYLDMN
jgi:hypothetical protein